MSKYKVIIVSFFLLLFSSPHANAQTIITGSMPLDNMPIVQDSELPNLVSAGRTVEEKRDEKYRFYLQSSVRIRVPSTNSRYSIFGSGTICYYDYLTKTAYVISCGHLFNGNKLPGQQGTQTCEIHVFYKNNIKLSKPQTFRAEVICYDNNQDISFLKFKPDWEPHYFPIANINYPIKEGDVFESTGCDDAKEVASYTVQIVKGMETGSNLVSKFNAAREGRSGGALLTPDGYYIGIVWGTGNGYSYYVPLRRIHQYAKNIKEVSFLLEVGHTAIVLRKIPIIDNKKVLSKDFIIPLPKY